MEGLVPKKTGVSDFVQTCAAVDRDSAHVQVNEAIVDLKSGLG